MKGNHTLENSNNPNFPFKLKLNGDKIIWLVILGLFCISIVSVFSSSASLVYQRYNGGTFSVLLKHTMYLLFSFSVIYIAHNVNYIFFKKYATIFFYLSIGLLVYTLLFGVNINGATRWLKIPFLNITIQTSEVAMLSLFIYLSKILSDRQKEIKTFYRGFLSCFLPILAVFLLIITQKFSTGLIILICGLVVMVIGRVSMKHITITSIITFSLIISSLVFLREMRDSNPTQYQTITQTLRLERLNTLYNRLSDFKNNDSESYQRQHADMAISLGGWFGLGPGKGSLKNFLPQAYNDYIYCSIIEEYGFLGAFVVVFLYVVLLHRIILIYRSYPYAFGSLLSLCVGFFIIIQAVIHLAVNVGLLPVTGITLPLISLGGTSLVLNSFGIGVILSVSRALEKDKQKKVTDHVSKLPDNISSIILGKENKPVL